MITPVNPSNPKPMAMKRTLSLNKSVSDGPQSRQAKSDAAEAVMMMTLLSTFAKNLKNT